MTCWDSPVPRRYPRHPARPAMKLLATVALLALTSPLAGQETPAPSDRHGALMRANVLYEEVIDLLTAAREAIIEDDLAAFDSIVRAYRRVMVLLTKWQARACWDAEHRGADPGYPLQATMGETLVSWTMANSVMETEEEWRVFRMLNEGSVLSHREMVRDMQIEMLRDCGE